MMDQRTVVLAGISGASASGKSNMVFLLKAVLGNKIPIYVLHQDMYFKVPNEIPLHEASGHANWECAEAIDFNRLELTLANLRKAKSLDEIARLCPEPPASKIYKVEDISSESPHLQFAQKISSLADNFVCKHHVLVLVEGFLLYHSEIVCSLLDVHIFLDISRDTCLLRRSLRGGYVCNDGTVWVEPAGYSAQLVWPEFLRYRKTFLTDGYSTGLQTMLNGFKLCIIKTEGIEKEEALYTALDFLRKSIV